MDKLKTATVAYQGVPGCYSFQAVLDYFKKDVRTVRCHNFKGVLDRLIKNQTDYGILPVENSTSGPISEVYELLSKYKFLIVGKIDLMVRHSLLGVAGASFSDISQVYSHQQALLQCGRFLSMHPDWKPMSYYNTAGSAEYISKQNRKDIACIAGKTAAKIYGLDVLQEDIQDNSHNITKFIIINKAEKQSSYHKLSSNY